MSLVTANLAISLDGFTAGPGQCLERPFGTGADVLTGWMFETDRPTARAARPTATCSPPCTPTRART